MKLSQYLDLKKLTDASFAEQLGISQSQVNRLKNARSMPSWGLAAKIEAATGGKVKLKDFADAKADQAEPDTATQASAA